ncbi:MAG: HPr(Ser) kinase/phosphatase [Clostridia bacterium]|nr:HPr(Ser) kinase/phosphatase [Clostridia bacterium]
MQEQKYTVTLRSLIKEFSLEEVYVPENIEQIEVTTNEVNRPGLQLAGFFDHFEHSRVQIIGKAEYHFLLDMTHEQRLKSFSDFFAQNVVCVIFSSGLEIFEEAVECAKKYGTPVLRAEAGTSHLMAALIASLNVSLAPRITRHGVLVEVYGEGILILGDSGIGKSEIAIELVKRGHRLIADDAVEIKRVSDKTLVGQAPELIRHYIELRGIGIVDVRRLFGMGSIKITEKIDLVVNLEPWQQGKFYERVGLETEYTDIMGIKVPSITIPVNPGRNLAVVLEIAAMNNRQKKMGYDTAVEFNKRLMAQMESEANR